MSRIARTAAAVVNDPHPICRQSEPGDHADGRPALGLGPTSGPVHQGVEGPPTGSEKFAIVGYLEGHSGVVRLSDLPDCP